MCSDRKALVRQVYDKIRSGDNVSLQDIAKHYDPEQHPEVVKNNCAPEDHYRNFLALWNLQRPSDTTTFEEF